MKDSQLIAADRDLQLLAEAQMLKKRDRNGGLPDRDDAALDDIEFRVVTVEWFDALEGLDENLRGELNYKLAKVRNHF